MAGLDRDALRVAHLARIGVDGRRLLADRELHAHPVEDRPATGRRRHDLVVLLRGEPLERRRAHDLQPERAAERQHERRASAPRAAGESAGSPRAGSFTAADRRRWSRSGRPGRPRDPSEPAPASGRRQARWRPRRRGCCCRPEAACARARGGRARMFIRSTTTFRNTMPTSRIPIDARSRRRPARRGAGPAESARARAARQRPRPALVAQQPPSTPPSLRPAGAPRRRAG